MKRSKLVVIMLLLPLAFSWFVSVGIVSAENPWDADCPGSTGSSDTSAATSTDFRPYDNGGPNAGECVDAFNNWLAQFYLSAYLYATSYVAVPSTVATVENGGKSQATTSSVRK